MSTNDDLSERLYARTVGAPLEATAFLSAQLDLSAIETKSLSEERIVAVDRAASSLAAATDPAREAAFHRWEAEMWCDVGTPSIAPKGSSIRGLHQLWLAARSLLRPDGHEVILNVDREEPGREILRWRYVSLVVPATVLVAAVWPLGRTPPSRVRLLHRTMAPDNAVAHQHVHHAAMIAFEELWASLRLRSLLTPEDLRRSLLHKNAWCPGLHEGSCLRNREQGKEQATGRCALESARHMTEWGRLLYNAFVARGLLDRHAGHGAPLELCQHEGCRLGLAVLRPFLRGEVEPRGFASASYPWPKDRFKLTRHRRKAHAYHLGARPGVEREAFTRMQVCDELSITSRAFAHSHAHRIQTSDETFDRLLLQYLRVKTALFRLLVHPPGEEGLEQFLKHFSQIKIYEPRSDQLRPAKPDEPGLTVAATEYRVAPDAWLRGLGRGERDHRGRPRPIEEISQGGRAGEAAWLIHFKRAKRDDMLLPLRGRSIRDMEEEARRIGNALEQKPERLRTLRGIDICGVEEQQPLWVCAETLRKLRERSSRIAGRRPGLKLQPLRLTLHAGEDFRWLTSGMRAIAEPFHWKLIERGDRIGHGIAVTLEPHRWWKKHQHDEPIQRKQIDRLQDLAFLATYSDQHPFQFGGRSEEERNWLAGEITDVVGALGLPLAPANGEPVDLIDEAKAFWTKIGGPVGRRLLERATAPCDNKRLHEHWLHRYFWNRRVQERAEDKRPVRANESTSVEHDLLARARRRLIRELARWQIPIESNPSSNLVVASLDAMMSQDFLAQTVEQAREAGSETLPWTISTDDPITFATSLADEYAYAWAGMVLRERKAYDPAHARALLDQAAATSMRTRFTVPNDDG